MKNTDCGGGGQKSCGGQSDEESDLPHSRCANMPFLPECLTISTTTLEESETTSLTILSSNVVNREIIYDYSYIPPKPIGDIRMVYAKDGNMTIDYYKLLGITANEGISAAVKNYLTKTAKETLGELTTLGGCPECTPLVAAYDVYQFSGNVKKVNDAITVESHLQVKVITYFQVSVLDAYLPPMLTYQKVK